MLFVDQENPLPNRFNATVLDALNKLPQQQHGNDIMRVRWAAFGGRAPPARSGLLGRRLEGGPPCWAGLLESGPPSSLAALAAQKPGTPQKQRQQ